MIRDTIRAAVERVATKDGLTEVHMSDFQPLQSEYGSVSACTVSALRNGNPVSTGIQIPHGELSAKSPQQMIAIFQEHLQMALDRLRKQ